jgi:Cof subfamily protein (haloacid dehalogenase superfamily)
MSIQPGKTEPAAETQTATRGGASRPAIRLVAIDLDGTLLNSEKLISDQTVEAMQCLPRGVRVVIASARPPRSVRHIYQMLRLDTWQINYNGALIWDEPNHRPVFHRPMAGELVRRMVDRARDMFDEVLVSCEIMDRWFTDRADQTYTTETGRLFKPDLIAPLDEFCNQAVTKLMFLCEPRVIDRLEPLLIEEFREHVAVVRTDDELIQVMDKRVSKAVALKKVAEHYGVPPEQVMAIGDAPNDVGMLQLAGVAVAMDNASKVVKKVADWVAPSNDDHGVHAALRRYGLCD